MPQYDDIDAMLGLGMEDPNRMAAGLRNQAYAGDIMASSNIGNMQRGGISDAKNARAGAKQAGVLKRARDAEDRRYKESADKDKRALKLARSKLEEQREYSEGQAAFKRTNKLADEASKRIFDTERQIEKEKRLRENPARSKPSAKERSGNRKSKQLLQQISRMQEVSKGFSESQSEEVDQPYMDVLLDWTPSKSLERYIGDQFVYTDPEVKTYRTKLARLESDVSKLASGLAVTGFEMEDRQKWSPYASGIAQDERVRRLDNLQELLQDEISYYEQDYGGGTPPQQPPMQPQQPPMQPQQPPMQPQQPPMQPEEKTVLRSELVASGATERDAIEMGYKVIEDADF